jgi:hypothetical protein
MTKHQEVVKLGLKYNIILGKIYNSLGSRSEPLKGISGVFEKYKLLLRFARNHKERLETVKQFRNEFSQVLETVLKTTLQASKEFTFKTSQIYQIKVTEPSKKISETVSKDLLKDFDSLVANILNAIALNISSERIWGNQNKKGLYNPAMLIRKTASMVHHLFEQSYMSSFVFDDGDDVYFKQAIAAIDFRTSPCCLAVNGQVKPFDEPFELTRDPRYANKLDWPPFHDYCRTVVVLVLEEEINDSITAKIKSDSAVVLAAVEKSENKQDV